MRSGWIRALAAVLSGLLLSSLVAPLGWFPLHTVAYLPVFWMLRQDTPRANRWLLLLYGTVAEGAIFAWIAETITLFSNIPGPLAWVILGLFAVVFGLPYLVVFSFLHPIRRRLGDLWIVALPAWLVVVEYISATVILFPYQQGISQYRFPYTWQLASVTGVWGLSFLVLFFNACFGEWIYRRREGRPAPVRWMASALVTLALVLAFGAWRYQDVQAKIAAAPELRVQQVQSPHTMIYRLTNPSSLTWEFWVNQTRAIPAGSVDLVVWPEGAVPFELNNSNAGTILWDLVRAGDFDMVVGSGTRERDPDPAMGEVTVRRFNSVYVFDRDAVAVPEDTAGPRQAWADLAAGGCDLDAAHVFTSFEARVLSTVGKELAGEADPCVAALVARQEKLADGSKLAPGFDALMMRNPGTWEAVRAQTSRFAVPLHERGFQARGTTGWWTLEADPCPGEDCPFFVVRCDVKGACTVSPEAPHYDKMVPLPFGEYLPLASTFPWLARLIEGPGNFRAGTEPVVFDTHGVRFGTPICYEGILSHVCRSYESPDLLVNVTNDAWFGDTSASDLHGMLVAARAIELGIPVFRSAYSGVSYVVEPDGTISDETPLFTEVNRPVTVRLARVDTLYSKLGDWFVAVCGLMLVVLGAYARRRAASAPGG